MFSQKNRSICICNYNKIFSGAKVHDNKKTSFHKLKKKQLVSKNILKSNRRAHIIHSFVQINCIVLPIGIKISSVQSLRWVWLFAAPPAAARQVSPSITNSQSLLNSCPSCRWCHPTTSSSVIPFSFHLQSFIPCIRVFSNESILCIRYQSFSFGISLSNEYSKLISFRMDWLDLLAVQGTLKSSPTPPFKSINSSALSFLYSLTLISIHDYRHNRSFD